MPHVRRLPPLDTHTTQATVSEANALEIDRVIDGLNQLDGLFELKHDREALHAVRAAAAFLRSRRNDELDDAARYRAAISDG